MAITLKQFGAQSATWLVTGGDSSLTFDDTQWGELTVNGKIKTLLTSVYLDSEGNTDRTAFFTAAAVAGFDTGFTSDMDLVYTWILSEGGEPSDPPKGTPVLNLSSPSAPWAGAIRLATSYSASE